MEPLLLNGHDLTIEALEQVVYHRCSVAIAPEALARAQKARQTLFDMAAAGKPVYGLNRGVGWNKDKEFDADFFERYNRNLINSHSVGVEPYCSVEEVRAMLCIRLNTALCGGTGISCELLSLYCEFLNRDIHPRVKRRGSIGEGDITTLSLTGQAFLGQGEVEYRGNIVPAADALAAEGLHPIVLGPKDGLSIVSSNAQGESLVALLITQVRALMRIADAVFCLDLEGLNGGVEPLGEQVNAIRGLPGQIESAARCRGYLSGSYLYTPDPQRALQDPLSFRCASAVDGTVLDALHFVERYFGIQINATDDNPYVFPENGGSCVSQNFETTTLAIGVEMLSIALNHLSKTVCYRLTHMADPAFTGLSRFLTPADVKTIAFGTIQKVYVALDAENRTLANPSSMDFIAVAGTIEDHASNLPLAAFKALQIVDNLRYMLGIELMHAAQAVDLRGNPALGKTTGALYTAYRAQIPFYAEDRNLSIDIQKSYDFIRGGALERLLGAD